jgi:hypothetical protein
MGRFAPVNQLDPHWVPRLPDLGRGSSALRGSIQRAQASGRRDSTSLSSRSPVDRPALASSLMISAALATSSVLPGGATGPLARSLSHSNPCRGTRSPACAGRAGRLEAARGRFDTDVSGVAAGRCEALLAACFSLAAGRPLARAGAVLAVAAAALALRAAARRGLERCGRVRGKFESTPWPFGRSLFFGVLMCTSLLNVSVRADRQTL